MPQFGEGGEPGEESPEATKESGLPAWAKERLNALPVFVKLDPDEDGPPHLNPDWIIAFYLFGDAVNVEQKFSDGLAVIKENHQNRFDWCSSCMAILDGAWEIAASSNLKSTVQLTEKDYDEMVEKLKKGFRESMDSLKLESNLVNQTSLEQKIEEWRSRLRTK